MEKKQQGNIFAIVIMFFLFAMISFVTGFQNPFGVIVKQQFAASNFMSQLATPPTSSLMRLWACLPV